MVPQSQPSRSYRRARVCAGCCEAPTNIPLVDASPRVTDPHRQHPARDNYITKPQPARAVGRACARCCGAAPSSRPPSIRARASADFDAVDVRVDGAPIKLTRRELESQVAHSTTRCAGSYHNRLLEQGCEGYDRVIENTLGRRPCRPAAHETRRTGHHIKFHLAIGISIPWTRRLPNSELRTQGRRRKGITDGTSNLQPASRQ